MKGSELRNKFFKKNVKFQGEFTQSKETIV